MSLRASEGGQQHPSLSMLDTIKRKPLASQTHTLDWRARTALGQLQAGDQHRGESSLLLWRCCSRYAGRLELVRLSEARHGKIQRQRVCLNALAHDDSV